MTRIGWKAGSLAVAAAVLTACQPATPPGAPPAPAPTPVTSAPGAPQFTEIAALCKAVPARLPVVKIQITDVSPKKIGHVTGLFESNQDGTASTEKKLRDLPEPKPDPRLGPTTRLDVDVTEFLKKEGDVVLVEVELADPNAEFVAAPAAVTAGNDDGVAIFCLKSKEQRISPTVTDRTVRFYVQDTGAKTGKYGKFNIFLQVKDGPYVTPIVLDPKMRDHG